MLSFLHTSMSSLKIAPWLFSIPEASQAGRSRREEMQSEPMTCDMQMLAHTSSQWSSAVAINLPSCEPAYHRSRATNRRH